MSNFPQGILPENRINVTNSMHDFFSIPASIRLDGDTHDDNYVFDEINTYDFSDNDEEMEDDADPANQQSDSDVSPHKYKYAEFDGKDGRNLLYKIVEQVTSDAVYKTWKSYVTYQKAGNDCYVGMTRLFRDMSLKLSLTERAIRWRWEQMMKKNLVIFAEKLVEVPLADGSTRIEVRHIKDFSPLYDLAYLFYQWHRSPGYIPPRYENAVAIRQQPELALWLATNFDCYRRVLCNNKAGRKPIPQPSEYERIEKQLIAAIARDESHESKLKSFSKSFSNNFSTYTEERRSKSHSQEEYTNVVASSSDLKKEGAAGALAIGTTKGKQNRHRNDDETKRTEGEDDRLLRKFETVEPVSETAAPMPVKTEKLQNEGNGELPAAWRAQIEQISARTPQKMIEQLVPYLQVWLNDQASEAHVRNSLTKFFKDKKIYDPHIARRTVVLALTKARKLPPEDVQKRNDDGSPNWWPKFWKALEPSLPIAIFCKDEVPDEVTEATPEPETVDPAQCAIVQLPPQEASNDLDRLTVPQLLEAAAYYNISMEPEERELIVHEDQLTTAALRELIWQESVDTETALRYDSEMTHALKLLKPIMMPVQAIPVKPCTRCGGQIGYTADDGQCYCVVCVPSYRWSSPTSKAIQSIVREIRSWEMVHDTVMDEIPLPVQNVLHAEGHDPFIEDGGEK